MYATADRESRPLFSKSKVSLFEMQSLHLQKQGLARGGRNQDPTSNSCFFCGATPPPPPPSISLRRWSRRWSRSMEPRQRKRRKRNYRLSCASALAPSCTRLLHGTRSPPSPPLLQSLGHLPAGLPASHTRDGERPTYSLLLDLRLE